MNRNAVVHVIDDDDAMRDSLAFLFDAAGMACRTYASARTFLERLPDGGCVITDVRMPDMTGIELLERLSDLGRPFQVVVITGHADVALAVEAMKLGAVDFIEKPFDDEVLLAAVRTACARDADTRQVEAERAVARQRLATLSARELEVLDGLVAGAPNKAIAHDLGISARTVEVYRANLMKKMHAASLSDLVRMALLAERERG
jgi:two-component system response regulator FixJ